MTTKKQPYIYNEDDKRIRKVDNDTVKIYNNGLWHTLNLSEIDNALQLSGKWIALLVAARKLLIKENYYCTDNVTTSFDDGM